MIPNISPLMLVLQPLGIKTDGTNLYVTDAYNYKIRKIVLSSQWSSHYICWSVGQVQGRPEILTMIPQVTLDSADHLESQATV